MSEFASSLPSSAASPYWWRSLAFPVVDEGPAHPPAACDAVIVGAGVAGLSAALQLALGGKDVIVLDTGPIGGGASSRNFASAGAGTNLAFLEGKNDHTALRAAREDQESFARLAALAAGGKDGCDFQFVPSVYVVRSNRQLDELALALNDFPEDRAMPTLLTKEALNGYIISDHYAGGMLSQGHAQFDAGKLLAHLKSRVVEAGGRLFAHHEVQRIDRIGDHIEVEGHGFIVRCRHALVATNGYIGPLGGAVGRHLRRGVIPLQANMIVTSEMEIPLVAQALPEPAIVLDNRQNFYCIRLSQDRRRILFATRTGERLSDKGRRAKLGTALRQLFPQISDMEVEYSWPGMIALTRDWRPHAGFIDGVGYITGCCGSGMVRHFGLGWRMAEAMIESRDPDTVYANSLPHLPPLVSKRVAAWAGVRWYDFLDWRSGNEK